MWKELTTVLGKAGYLKESDQVTKRTLPLYLERLKEEANIETIVGARYHILKELSRDDFSKTYLAEDRHLPEHTKCIVKQLNSQSESITRRFGREARVLSRLGKHPQIPQLYAYFEENRYFYLVHEFTEGLDIKEELVEGKPWSGKEDIALIKEILSILVFL